MRHALTILTFVPDRADGMLLERLPAAIESLERSEYEGAVTIVDDGSRHPRQLATLNSLSRRYAVLRRENNGGICRAKNTCLRVLMEQNCDVGFIAEDDIEFRSGWHCKYLEAHAAVPDLHHLSWAWDEDPSGRMRKYPELLNGYPVVRTSRLNGLFLTMTPTVVSVVGGFQILPHKWGHTHTNWTRRIIKAGLSPFFTDVEDSNRYLRCNSAAVASTISDNEKRRFAIENQTAAFEFNCIHCPIAE